MSSGLVVGLGNCTIDYMAFVPRIISGGEKGVIEGSEVHPGGIMANSLTQLARLGLETEWIGFIGDDDNGKRILREFHTDGIGTNHIVVRPGEQSSYCWVLVAEDGERAGYVVSNVTASITPRDVSEYFRVAIQQADMLLVEVTQFPVDAVAAAIEIAKKAGTRVILDLDSPPTEENRSFGNQQQVDEIVAESDVVATSLVAAAEYTGLHDYQSIAKHLLSKGPELVVITLGRAGCCLADADRFISVPGFSVNVVDTTGAGDAFHGGLAYGLMMNWDLETVGRFANACGALCCTRFGARGGYRLEDVRSFMDSGVVPNPSTVR